MKEAFEVNLATGYLCLYIVNIRYLWENQVVPKLS